MKQRNYSSHAFVLSRKNYGEADRIIHLFTKAFGKVSVIAKGVRKVTSRKRGGLEVFSLIKFSASKGKSLDILTEVEVIDGFEEVRTDLKKVSLAYYFCEVVGKLTREEEENSVAFELLKKYFEELKVTKSLKTLRLNFLKELLITLGFWPHGKEMLNPDAILEEVTERKINSVRVGKRMLRQE